MTMIPIPTRSEPPRCPGCRREEDTREVCRHCGYEYADWTPSGWQVLGCIAAILIASWLVLSIGVWGANTAKCTSRDAFSEYHRCYPLTDYLTAPVRWAERADLW